MLLFSLRWHTFLCQAKASEGIERELEHLIKDSDGNGVHERRLKVIEIGRYEMDTWYVLFVLKTALDYN